MPKRTDCSLIGRHSRVLIIWSIFSQAEHKEQKDSVRTAHQRKEERVYFLVLLSCLPLLSFPLRVWHLPIHHTSEYAALEKSDPKQQLS